MIKDRGLLLPENGREPLVLGPLMAQILEIQDRNASATAFPEIGRRAQWVVDTANRLRVGLLWPVGEPGQRLTGAAVLLAAGTLRVRGWSHGVDEPVLLVAAHAATTAELRAEAAHAGALGASAVHAVAISLAAADESATSTFASLSIFEAHDPGSGQFGSGGLLGRFGLRAA